MEYSSPGVSRGEVVQSSELDDIGPLDEEIEEERTPAQDEEKYGQDGLESPLPDFSKQPCFFIAVGSEMSCSFGETCRFSHEQNGDMQALRAQLEHEQEQETSSKSNQNQPKKAKICKAFNRGLCKYGNQCRFLHAEASAPQPSSSSCSSSSSSCSSSSSTARRFIPKFSENQVADAAVTLTKQIELLDIDPQEIFSEDTKKIVKQTQVHQAQKILQKSLCRAVMRRARCVR